MDGLGKKTYAECIIKTSYMKTFKFEITLTDEMLEGDEFWEDAIKRDGTGITELTECLQRSIEGDIFTGGIPLPPFDIKEIVVLKEYKDV